MDIRQLEAFCVYRKIPEFFLCGSKKLYLSQPTVVRISTIWKKNFIHDF